MEIPSESSSGSEKIKGRRKDKFQADDDFVSGMHWRIPNGEGIPD
jgi:hypothetical protein